MGLWLKNKKAARWSKGKSLHSRYHYSCVARFKELCEKPFCSSPSEISEAADTMWTVTIQHKSHSSDIKASPFSPVIALKLTGIVDLNSLFCTMQKSKKKIKWCKAKIRFCKKKKKWAEEQNKIAEYKKCVVVKIVLAQFKGLLLLIRQVTHQQTLKPRQSHSYL